MTESAFTTAQLSALEDTLAKANALTGLRFSAYVGPMPNRRESALALQRGMDNPNHSVLIAVDPDARTLEIVTGAEVTERLDERACQLAAMSMSSRFAIGDIAAGIRDGVFALAEHARIPQTLHTNLPG